jgi:hypothetical protein
LTLVLCSLVLILLSLRCVLFLSFFSFFFERVFSFFNRIMVGLPSMESRGLILRRLLSKEKVDEGLDFKELATMTEG